MLRAISEKGHNIWLMLKQWHHRILPLQFLIQNEIFATKGQAEKTVIEFEKQGSMSIQELLALVEGAVNGENQTALPKTAASQRMQLINDAFALSAEGKWQQALDRTIRYRTYPHRESANTLGMGLLNCQLLDLAGYKQNAYSALTAYRKAIQNPWYRSIAACLMDESKRDGFVSEMKETREKTLTMAMAMGLRAEAQGNPEKAIEYYNDALDTGLTNWMEFKIAMARRHFLHKGGQS